MVALSLHVYKQQRPSSNTEFSALILTLDNINTDEGKDIRLIVLLLLLVVAANCLLLRVKQSLNFTWHRT